MRSPSDNYGLGIDGRGQILGDHGGMKISAVVSLQYAPNFPLKIELANHDIFC